MPPAACRTRLLLVNLPSVEVCPGFSSCDTRGQSAPFRVRAGTPSRPMTARRSLPPASLTCTTLPRRYRWATLGERRTGLPRVARSTHRSGEDASGHRGGRRVCRCAVNTHRPAPHAVLALGPTGGSSPARVTRRHTEASLTLSIPIMPRGTSGVPLTFRTCTACLRPHRCQ